MPAWIGPAIEREKKANRRSPVLRTTDGDTAAALISAKRDDAAMRRDTRPRADGSNRARGRAGAAWQRRGSVTKHRAGLRETALPRRRRWEDSGSLQERGPVRRVHFETREPPRRRSSSPRAARLRGVSQLLRMGPTARPPCFGPAPAFGNSPARSPAPACFVTTHKKRGTPTFPLRARDLPVTDADSLDEGRRSRSGAVS
ncbi:hypothetical protein AWB78_03373 [Caballeronia calidae]|uniref:Uncharacterized protein n=1 Tax=Caballeronia calidae TaxID=1777139 RepID=A0A158C243_9BURK|nr:hypothetical protein AWB78_03373 [Caballeronia calidae]